MKICFIIVVCIFALLPIFTTAQPVITAQSKSRILIGRHIEYYVDSTGKSLIDEISRKHFSKSQDHILNLGLIPYTVWMRFQVKALEEDDFYLEIMTPLVENLNIYRSDGSRHKQYFSSGFNHPFHKRPIHTENLIIPLNLKRGITHTFYIRANTGYNFQIPIAIASKEKLVESGEIHYLFWGIYIGVMIFALVYNFFIYLSVRERRYLFYILYVIGSTAFYLGIQGFAFQFIWPLMPALNKNIVVLICATNIIITFFTLDFLNISKREKKLYYSAQGIVVIFFLIALVNIFGPYAMSVGPAQGLSLVICIFCIYAGIDSLKRGIRSARYFLTAWTLFALLTMTFVLTINNVITSNFFTTHCIFIGHMTEVLLLSFALADRINSLKWENEHFQKELVNSQQKIQEQILQQISQELHDNVNQVLGVVAIVIGTIQYQFDEKKQELENAQNLLYKAISDLRDLSRSLNTDFINEIGLEDALRQQLEMLRNTNRYDTVLVTHMESYRLSGNHDLVVFRVIQELLQNIVKHANATVINVRMDYSKDNLLIVIRDNGRGIGSTGSDKTSTKGIGLHNIQNRVNLLQGSINIEGKKDNGTTATLIVPR
jgi:signal transduction histidine kinase